MFFRLGENFQCQSVGAVVLELNAEVDQLVVSRHSARFEDEVVLELLLHVGADADHVVASDLGHPIEEEYALDELVRVLHLAHRLFPVLGRELEETPVLAHLGLAEILIDGRQLDGERPIEGFDDLGIPLHGRLRK